MINGFLLWDFADSLPVLLNECIFITVTEEPILHLSRPRSGTVDLNKR